VCAHNSGREAGLEALWTMHFPSVQISIYPLAQCSPEGGGHDGEGHERGPRGAKLSIGKGKHTNRKIRHVARFTLRDGCG
jgi:hypothetical protein